MNPPGGRGRSRGSRGRHPGPCRGEGEGGGRGRALATPAEAMSRRSPSLPVPATDPSDSSLLPSTPRLLPFPHLPTPAHTCCPSPPHLFPAALAEACRSAPECTALRMPRYERNSPMSALRLSPQKSGSSVMGRSKPSRRSRVTPLRGGSRGRGRRERANRWATKALQPILPAACPPPPFTCI